MLLRLLRLISDAKGVATTREMALKLGVTEGLMKQMIDQAVAMGYLAPLRPDCSEAPCHACQERCSCLLVGSARLWSLTDKGERLLANKPAIRPAAEGQ